MTEASSETFRRILVDDTSPDVVREPNLKVYLFDATMPNAASGTITFAGLTTLKGAVVNGEAAQPTATSKSTNVLTVTITALTVVHGIGWGV